MLPLVVFQIRLFPKSAQDISNTKAATVFSLKLYAGTLLLTFAKLPQVQLLLHILIMISWLYIAQKAFWHISQRIWWQVLLKAATHEFEIR